MQLSISTDSDLIKEEELGYSAILAEYGLEFRRKGSYLEVGEPCNPGWVLHISVIKIQLLDLLQKLVPFLASENVPFQVVARPKNAISMLNSGGPFELLGKLVCIFPENDTRALYLSKRLITLTGAFKGPAIPTDKYLGGCVYVGYSDKKQSGDETDFKPRGITWPFTEITSPSKTRQRKFLAGKYLPVLILKTDSKGRVFKAIRFNKIFRPDWCLVKQGKHNMCTDESGRDMHDRLLWQQKLHVQLSSIIRVPRLIDMFTEQNDTYLVMEFINGKSLNELVEENMSVQRRISILITICECLSILHQQGYIHRDLSSVNFMVNNKNEVSFIDLELAYSIKTGEPNPPYTWGTEGFMSPEQINNAKPTIEQDIYGLGSLLLYTLTGVTPLDCGHPDLTKVEKVLLSNISYKPLNRIILFCLDPLSEKRPCIYNIIQGLKNFASYLIKTS